MAYVKKGNLGGARTGAGRPEGSVASATLRAMQIREYICERLQQDAEEIYNILMDQARGGNVQAIKELFDRGLGKPLQSVDHKNDGGKFEGVVFLPAPLESDE